MRRQPAKSAATALVVSLVVLAGGCSLSMRGAPARMPATPGSPTGMIPARLQTASSLGTLISWKDLTTLNPALASYRKLGRDSQTGADIYGPAPATTGAPAVPGGSASTPGTGGTGSAGAGGANTTGQGATVGATPLAPGMYVLVDASGRVVGVRAQLPAGLPGKPWYDAATTGPTGPGTTGPGGTSTGGTGTGTGGTTGTGAAPGGVGPGTAGTGTTPRTGMTTGVTTSGPTMTALFTARRGAPGATGPGGTTGRGTSSPTTPPAGTTNTTATAGASNLRSYSAFKADNPSWDSAEKLSDFVPGMGTHYGHPGPGLALMTDKAGHVTAFEVSFPAARDGSDWKPYYDQLPGKPMYDPKTGSYMWSQHVYFIAPEVIR
ncbi:MAG: hypothetical protein IRZ11_04250 [Clostridia bacterium]|nr:hypothetical protein [Clostridia bacterium]